VEAWSSPDALSKCTGEHDISFPQHDHKGSHLVPGRI